MTVYFTYDTDGYFTGTAEQEVAPENATVLAPELDAGYWSKFGGKVWTNEKIPETVSDIIGLSVPAMPTSQDEEDKATQHQSLLRSIIMRILSDTEDAKAVIADGILTVVEVTDEDKLNAAKLDKLEELNNIAHKFDDQLVCDEMIIKSSLGFTANADLRTQNNIAGLINVGVEPVQYCDAENKFHSLTLENLATLQSEILANGQNLYTQKWVYRNKINTATTIAELNAIEVKFEMMDFSKAE